MKHAKKSQGVIFIIAIISLAAMLITGLAFTQHALQQLRDSNRKLKSLQALSRADSGISYALWTQKYGPESGRISDVTIGNTPLPSDFHAITTASMLTLPSGDWEGGTGKVWIYPIPGREGYYVVSQGTYRNFTHTVRSVARGVTFVPDPPIPPLPPFMSDFALFCDGPLQISGSSATYEGNIGSNTNVATGGSAEVHGNAYIATGGTTDVKKGSLQDGGKIVVGPVLAMPDWTKITMDEWKNATLLANRYTDASQVPFGSTNLFGQDNVLDGRDIVYIDTPDTNGDGLGDGTVILNNTTFLQAGTLVVNGTLKITANLYGPDGLSPENTGLVMIANRLEVEGNGEFYGLMYGKSAKLTGGPSIFGGVITDQSLELSGTESIFYRKALPPTQPPDDEDDGDGANSEWTLASWELLN